MNTVSTTLEWMLLLSTNEPHYQARARVDALANESINSSSSTANTTYINTTKGYTTNQFRRKKKASYVDALLKETLRSKPPLLLPRQTMVDTTIGQNHILTGQIVMANNWALTHNTKWWTGTDPHTFSPERWLVECG